MAAMVSTPITDLARFACALMQACFVSAHQAGVLSALHYGSPQLRISAALERAMQAQDVRSHRLSEAAASNSSAPGTLPAAIVSEFLPAALRNHLRHCSPVWRF